jgi:hypothetical protein
MMKRITVKVTQEHIDRRGKSPLDCPVALALSDLGYDARVFSDNIYLYDDRVDFKPRRISPPSVAARWIRNYDYYQMRAISAAPVPFEFDLEVPTNEDESRYTTKPY